MPGYQVFFKQATRGNLRKDRTSLLLCHFGHFIFAYLKKTLIFYCSERKVYFVSEELNVDRCEDSYPAGNTDRGAYPLSFHKKPCLAAFLPGDHRNSFFQITNPRNLRKDRTSLLLCHFGHLKNVFKYFFIRKQK